MTHQVCERGTNPLIISEIDKIGNFGFNLNFSNHVDKNLAPKYFLTLIISWNISVKNTPQQKIFFFTFFSR